MRIAVFHNFMDNIGGAERVGLTLARELGADIYTTNIDYEKIKRMGFYDVRIHSIGTVPLNPPFRQEKTLALFRKLDLGHSYDCYIIDGDWAVSGAFNNKPNIWYVHSPIREIWDLYEYTRSHTVPFLFRPAFDAWVYKNRRLNRQYVREVNRIVTNSENTADRVMRYLGKNARVIYPPVDIFEYSWKRNGDFWLSVNRLISHKRIEIQMEALRALPDQKLTIVGSYEHSRHFTSYAKAMHRIKPPNVTIVSWINQSRLRELYATCKGLIVTAKDEDFGLTPVEAMAAGKPVIAPREGGFRESVIDGVTGMLIDTITPQKIVHAMRAINDTLKQNTHAYRKTAQVRALDFDTKIFVERMLREANAARGISVTA